MCFLLLWLYCKGEVRSRDYTQVKLHISQSIQVSCSDAARSNVGRQPLYKNLLLYDSHSGLPVGSKVSFFSETATKVVTVRGSASALSEQSAVFCGHRHYLLIVVVCAASKPVRAFSEFKEQRHLEFDFKICTFLLFKQLMQRYAGGGKKTENIYTFCTHKG